MDPRWVSSFICYGATGPSSWLWEKQAREAIQPVLMMTRLFAVRVGSTMQTQPKKARIQYCYLHATDTQNCWSERDMIMFTTMDECYTRNTLGSEGKRSRQKMHHMQKIWGETIHCSPSPDLPTDRVYEGPPLTYTGIDFAGPLYVNSVSPENRSKAYCCLFTCTSTRAVHLELTESLTVTSFLQPFRRFVSQRGLPAKLLTDNVKTFKSASVDVKKISRSSEVKQYLANRQVDWQFIMERVPWWGGFWERLVSSVKQCLKKSVRRSLLTFEELCTLVVEIEATLNNRPLTYIYDDERTLIPTHSCRLDIWSPNRHRATPETLQCH